MPAFQTISAGFVVIHQAVTGAATALDQVSQSTPDATVEQPLIIPTPARVQAFAETLPLTVIPENAEFWGGWSVDTTVGNRTYISYARDPDAVKPEDCVFVDENDQEVKGVLVHYREGVGTANCSDVNGTFKNIYIRIQQYGNESFYSGAGVEQVRFPYYECSNYVENPDQANPYPATIRDAAHSTPPLGNIKNETTFQVKLRCPPKEGGTDGAVIGGAVAGALAGVSLIGMAAHAARKKRGAQAAPELAMETA